MTRAIDQLGSSQLDVRLGGIFAFERIARDSADDLPQVVEVLTAYVREHSRWRPDPTSEVRYRDQRGGTTVTQGDTKVTQGETKVTPAAARARPAIAAIGECLIDFTPVERAGVLTGFDVHPGGSPLNVAVAIARLAHPAAFATRVSTDFFGERIVAHLVANGIRTDLLSRGPEPTTLAFVAYSGHDAEYSFRSDGAADTLLRAAEVPAERFDGLAGLHFGSISLLHPITAATVVGLLRQLKGRVTLTFDPNVRASLVGDWEAYAHVVHECLRLADLVRLSEEDVGAWEAATGEDLLAVARAAADHPVLVTRATRGSTLYGPGAALEVPGRPVRVVDTVGAGDAYMAGLLVGLAECDGLEGLRRGGTPDRAGWRTTMEFATATAALTCQRQGGHPPARAEVNEALGTVGLAGVGA